MIRIYIIEDHSVIVDGIKQRLRHHAEEFSIAGNSGNIQEFIRMAVPGSFDLILLDLWLPGTDPAENINLIRKHLPAVPIVIYTSETASYWIGIMMELGARAYLLKSAGAMEFKETLRKVYQGHTVKTVLLPEEPGTPATPAVTDAPYLLKPSERAIILALVGGLSLKNIAKERNLTTSAIEKTIRKIRDKYGAANDAQLIRILMEQKII